MQTMTVVALDTMGGDNAPAEIVKGAVDAVSSRGDIKVKLVGQEDVVREELVKYSYPQERIEVVENDRGEETLSSAKLMRMARLASSDAVEPVQGLTLQGSVQKLSPQAGPVYLYDGGFTLTAGRLKLYRYLRGGYFNPYESPYAHPVESNSENDPMKAQA